jgi:hypothetical protein
MKTRKFLIALGVLLMGAVAAESAFAGGRARVSVGIGIGVPVGGWGYGYGGYGYGYGWGRPYYGYGYGYPYPYAPYYAAPVVVQQQPTVYVEQPQAEQQAAQNPAGYWYYCNDARAYYPYVKECPAGWQRVAPQPAN